MALTKISRGLLDTGVSDSSDATAITIDSSENVGIGTSSPNTKLDVTGSSTNGSGIVDTLRLRNTGTSGNDGARIQFTAGASTSGAGIASGGQALNSADLRFYAGGNTERMRITNEGRVGIGTSSPSQHLTVSGSDNNNLIMSYNTGSGNNSMRIQANTSASYIVSSGSVPLIFDVVSAERMRVHSNGTISMGTTSTNSASTLNVASSSIDNQNVGIMSIRSNDSGETASECLLSLVSYRNDNSTSNVVVKFAINQYNSGNGQINFNGAGQVAFGSFSDSRLKENITDLPSQLDNIVALQPKEFDYIESEGGGHQIGFVAQDVEEIYPDLVGEREDGMKTLSGMSKMEARLISAIKELKTELDAAKARIETLENA